MILDRALLRRVDSVAVSDSVILGAHTKNQYGKPKKLRFLMCYAGDNTMTKAMRVAIYVRVGTGEQTTALQRRELTAWAERAGHTIVKVYEDKGISGAKGRDKRPSFDALLKAAVRREVDMIAVWSSDRLGRSLSHLVEVLQTIRETGTGLYIHTQAVDTTTPAGRAMFGPRRTIRVSSQN
jgi:predicted site-specific integrase-resolvase